MGKIDAVKSKINVLTALMIVFLTALFAVIGYTFTHKQILSFIDMCYAVSVALALLILFCGSMWLIRKEIKILEKM